MNHDAIPSAVPEGPWNPGIASVIPEPLRPLCTYLRPENVVTSVERAGELRDLTGLPLVEVVAFRPERLALHELLVRVTARISVPDGSRIEDLGINFREITRRILARHIEPRMTEIRSAWTIAHDGLTGFVARELDRAAAAGRDVVAQPGSGGWRRNWLRWLGANPARRAPRDAAVDERVPAFDELTRAIARWDAASRTAEAPLERAGFHALAKVVSAVFVRHGTIRGRRDPIASLAVDVACNAIASDEIGRLIESWLGDAVAAEGCALLPAQARPVILNTKGPSASGKSTLRPLQRKLAGDIGVDWSEFALISPDIWRKQLIDYASLGRAYKYGGAFTGDELHVIDLKLDRYMARRAADGEVPHLLIDRFRFDSFAPDSSEAGSNLLTRFGQVVYLFFMIAPPEMLVERAWKRGLEVGRYKAVDDTLAHAVEAYSGMPDLFFTWIDRRDKDVQFEFLDNSVKAGERPRTAAFGSNRRLNVLDPKCLIDIERFCRIDVEAAAPGDLYRDREGLAAERNAGFLTRCVNRFPEVVFAERSTGRILVRVASGAVTSVDREALGRAFEDPQMRSGLLAALPALSSGRLPEGSVPEYLDHGADLARLPTLGEWGGEAR